MLELLHRDVTEDTQRSMPITFRTRVSFICEHGSPPLVPVVRRVLSLTRTCMPEHTVHMCMHVCVCELTWVRVPCLIEELMRHEKLISIRWFPVGAIYAESCIVLATQVHYCHFGFGSFLYIRMEKFDGVVLCVLCLPSSYTHTRFFSTFTFICLL